MKPTIEGLLILALSVAFLILAMGGGVVMEKYKITDVFHQSAGDGVPAHWCVQWYESGWANYEYFATKEEAVEFALQHDCDEGLL